MNPPAPTCAECGVDVLDLDGDWNACYYTGGACPPDGCDCGHPTQALCEEHREEDGEAMNTNDFLDGLENTDTNMVRYPEIDVRLVGTDGNAFALMGTVTRALRQHRVPADEIKTFQLECMNGDYNHLLSTCMQWVNVS